MWNWLNKHNNEMEIIQAAVELVLLVGTVLTAILAV